jgi:hypothetical protein
MTIITAVSSQAGELIERPSLNVLEQVLQGLKNSRPEDPWPRFLNVILSLTPENQAKLIKGNLSDIIIGNLCPPNGDEGCLNLDFILDFLLHLKNKKTRQHWITFYTAAYKLSKVDRLLLVQKAYGSITENELRGLIDVLLCNDVCKVLKIENVANSIPYTLTQFEAAKKAKLNLAYCPSGWNLKKIDEISFGDDMYGNLFCYTNSHQNIMQLCKGDTESFYYTTFSRPGYYFVGEPGEATLGGDYLEQTKSLSVWLKENISLSLHPELILEAIEEFEVKEISLRGLFNSRDKDKIAMATNIITSLLLNKNYRENSPEFAIRLLVSNRTRQVELYNGQFVFLNDTYQDKIVSMGRFDYRGIKIVLRKAMAPGSLGTPKIF